MNAEPEQPEAEERGPFFIVNKRGQPEVMSQAEVAEEDDSVTLAGGHFDTRAEAEAALAAGEFAG